MQNSGKHWKPFPFDGSSFISQSQSDTKSREYPSNSRCEAGIHAVWKIIPLQGNTHTLLAQPVHLPQYFLEGGRKLDNLEETQADAGTNSNPSSLSDLKPLRPCFLFCANE